jgi:hypothetical protein
VAVSGGWCSARALSKDSAVVPGNACTAPAGMAGLLFHWRSGAPCRPARSAGRPRRKRGSARASGHAARTRRRSSCMWPRRLPQRLGDVGVVIRLAARDPDSGGADVGAVQAQPDALDHLGHVLLAQVIPANMRERSPHLGASPLWSGSSVLAGTMSFAISTARRGGSPQSSPVRRRCCCRRTRTRRCRRRA